MKHDFLNDSNCTFKSMFCGWYSLSKPFLSELPFVMFFMKLMGLKTICELIVQRANVLENVSKFPTYLNLFGRIAILFLFAYLLAAVLNVIRKDTVRRCVKSLFYLIIILLFSIRYFLLSKFGLEISPTCFVLLAETTATESKEFIDQYILSYSMLPLLRLILGYVSAIIVAEVPWFFIKKRVCKMKKTPLLALLTTRCLSLFLALVLAFGLFSTNIYWRVYNAENPDFINSLQPPADPLSSIYTSLVTLQMMSRNVADAIEVNKKVHDAENAYTTQEDSINVVVVIGESYIKWHSQLYGYSLATTPNLKKEQQDGRLFVFNDVISSSKSTSIMMREIFGCNSNGVKEQWYNYPTFLTIFKKAGYNVCFWDNQRDYDKMATYSFTLNSFLYNPDLQNIIYTLTNSESHEFDGGIVESFNNDVDIKAYKHNLILFHLQGQHVTPSSRFPHDTFKYFTADSIKRDDAFLTNEMKEYIADYDNATLYNDYVMSRIIDIFRDSNTVLLYFSDHGEEAYDYRGQCGRDYGKMTPLSLKYQFEIPFMIWCSDLYKEKRPDVIDRIQQAVDRPFVLDNIHHILFELGGVETSYYSDSLNLISPHYECKERYIKVLSGEYVYEKIRNTGE